MREQINSNNVSVNSPDARPKRPALLLILLILLVILFVFSSLLALISFNIWRVAFNPPLVKRILEDEFIKTNLVPHILEDLSIRRTRERTEKGDALSGVNEPDIELLVSFIRLEDWSDIKDLIVTDDFIIHLISTSVDGVYAWIDGNSPLPNFSREMASLKDRLSGQEGKDAIMIAYKTLPECTPEQIDDFNNRQATTPRGVGVPYNLCQFPQPYREDQIDDYIHALVDINANLPEEYDFNQMLAGNPESNSSMTLIKNLLRSLRFFGQWSWGLSLLLMVLIAAIGVRSLKDASNWLGIPLAVVGLLSVGFYYFTGVILIDLLLTRLNAQISPLLQTELSASLSRFLNHFFKPLLLEGAILLVIGVVLYVVGLTIKKKPGYVVRSHV